MKKNIIILLFASILVSGCDKGFEELNTNPQALTSIDPGFLFTTALRNTQQGSLEAEQTVALQFLNAYSGLTTGFNLNQINDGQNRGRWNGTYTGPIKFLEHAISILEADPSARVNLYNQARIWRAYNYMTLVDTYGDVPYSEAGRAYLDANFYPKYDKDELVYDGLYAEIKAASAALDAGASNEARYDLFYAGDIAKWKRLGYSLLLRLGMRYSKLDANKARTIVQEAYNGGVMLSNADNAKIAYNSVNNNPLFSNLRTANSNYYYFAEPFINQLKTTTDPRLKYLAGKYADAGGNHSQVPDTTTANQVGFPVGQDNVSIMTYPGRVIPTTAGSGFNYSQINFYVLGNALAPLFFVTNAQTKLLLAEAAQRGWLTGLAGAKTAQEYYEEGVKASMDEYSIYPNGFGAGTIAIPLALQNEFLAQPSVAYSAAEGLRLINTQYWVASFSNGVESWANFRRSGFPVLTPNPTNPLGGGGFVRRFTYPAAEQGVNRANYDAAKASLGGDDLITRIFWDTP
jgi:hypothetical protein